MSDEYKGWVAKVRDAVLGPPIPKNGTRLPENVRKSMEEVDKKATFLHEFAIRVQRRDERKVHG